MSSQAKQDTEQATSQVVYLNPSKAAEFLGTSVQTLANWRARRQGPKYLKMGARLIRYRQDDLAAWMHTRIIEPENY